MKDIKGLETIVDDFDLFLIDQFGVLHNGIQAYPQALRCLEQLKEHSRSIVVVSNSGKRSWVNMERMASLGFPPASYDHFVSSGEVAFRYLTTLVRERQVKNCFLISREDDRSAIDGLGLDIVDRAEQADLILISGCEPEKHSEQDYLHWLEAAAQQQVLCFCTNPDKTMLTKSGTAFGAGRIAEIYEGAGGQVTWIGKPYPAIYQYIQTLYSDHDKSRIVCVGDSVEHDIAGGKSAGLRTLLVKTGLAEKLDGQQLTQLTDRYDATPDFVMHELCFGDE